MMENNYEPHRFPYKWYLKDGYPTKGIENHGCKVFGTFICGGGSSMGYKLAGYHHLGGVELDPKVAEIYKANHHPEYLYNMDIRDFNKKEDLPWDLYNLDLLDGSPPCSTFSTAGSRDKAWGKEKRFAEGQKLQRLDDLVFVYCDTILKLRPKCFILENVSGLVKGNAKSYAKRIVNCLTENDYTVQVFLLNAATMGVPQKRERVFFIGHRKEYKLPKLVLEFNEKPIVFGEFAMYNGHSIEHTERMYELWKNRQPSDRNMSQAFERLYNGQAFFGQSYAFEDKVVTTLTTQEEVVVCYNKPVLLSNEEFSLVGTYPLDYNTLGKNIKWLIGMSVPPVMTAQVAYQIYRQWLSKINNN